MAVPNASYSVCIRVEVDHKPGSLGRVATAIGDAGGNIAALDIVEVAGGRITRDVTVYTVDDGHVERICNALDSIEGVVVRGTSDRVFLMHEGGKIAVQSKIPLQN